MDLNKLTSLVNRGSSSREIAIEFSVSHGTIQKWLKTNNLKTSTRRGPKTSHNTKCKVCNNETEQGKMYCSTACKSRYSYLKHIETKKTIDSKILRVNLKIQALEYCGKECKHCGYNTNYTALSFHHLDPSKKDFSPLGTKRNKNLTDIQKSELDKCITLCHNCHAIEHERLEKPINERSKQAIKGFKIRQELIKSKGGKCSSCNITGINRIFAFHHVDPTTKLFTIDNRTCNGYKMERLKIEADKCIVLCHNCHSELHNSSSVYQFG